MFQVLIISLYFSNLLMLKTYFFFDRTIAVWMTNVVDCFLFSGDNCTRDHLIDAARSVPAVNSIIALLAPMRTPAVFDQPIWHLLLENWIS